MVRCIHAHETRCRRTGVTACTAAVVVVARGRSFVAVAVAAARVERIAAAVAFATEQDLLAEAASHLLAVDLAAAADAVCCAPWHLECC